MNDNAYLELSRLTKSYPSPKGEAVIVKDVDFKFRKGEFVTVIGHSGCGKSTILMMVAGLSSISGGTIILAGKELTGPGPDRGVVFQSPSLLPWLTAFENVMLGVSQVAGHLSRKRRGIIVEHYLRLVGLDDAMHARPGELSAGMKQRVGLARAFALSPKLLLLDEPFGALDSLTRFELQDVLLQLCAEDRKTAFMVTHDVDEALFLSDRVAMMTSNPGRLGGIVQVPFSRPRSRTAVLEHPRYYELREELLGFLNNNHATAPSAPSAGDAPQPVLQQQPELAVT